MRVCGYVRVSSGPQEREGLSPVDQRNKIERYCETNNLDLVAVIEDAYSGRTLERPGFSSLLERAAAGEFDVVLCAVLDRLSRGPHLDRMAEQALAKSGVRILFTDQVFDATPSGRFFRTIMSGAGELESDLITARTQAGRYAKARERGVWPSQFRMFGLRSVTVAMSKALPEFAGRSGEILIDESEAAYVREAYQRIADGGTVRTVAEWLQHEGQRGPRGGKMGPGIVHGILRHPAYVGRLRYSDLQLECPAIVSPDLWDRVQARLAENRARLSGPKTYLYLLRGIITCAACNRAICGVGSRHKYKDATYRYVYYCCSRGETGLGCGLRIRADKLEKLAVAFLRRQCRPENVLRLAERHAIGRDPTTDVDRLAAQIAAADTELSRVADLVLAGLPPHVVRDKNERLSDKRRKLIRRLTAAKTRTAPTGDVRLRAERLAESIAAALAEWDEHGDRERMQRLCRRVLRVVLERGKSPRFRLVF